MTLEMTLPERPGFLHVLPVVDLFLLLVLFFMVGPSLLLQSGLKIELPPSKFQMERFQDTLVVTLGPGQPPGNIHFGRLPVTFDKLAGLLDRKRADGSGAKAVVLLQSDVETPVRLEREVAEMILGKGFRLALVGQAPTHLQAPAGAEPDKPEPP
jgi:biopolymer transport protein ExbD